MIFHISITFYRTITPGTLCIDSSTIDQIASVEIAKLTAEKGASYIDAPVSGGVGGAQAGTLTFMVGGPQKDFDRAKPLLQNMGKSVVHCGDVGTGQAAKICNNMLLGIEMIGVAEAMNLGVKMGLDPKLLAGIINTSSGRCWSSDTYNPVPHVIEGIPSCKNYEGGFGASLMAKVCSFLLVKIMFCFFRIWVWLKQHQQKLKLQHHSVHLHIRFIVFSPNILITKTKILVLFINSSRIIRLESEKDHFRPDCLNNLMD